ncbi:hypothetical protein V6617_02835 [Pelagibacterium nitratireducens]|uniref:HEAT repeat domain-containing protein n=1 Tax=Pelagibacterium nitratireducens TaxID=1046114 RepID=A0ABZ2I252_9HYPH
MPSEASQAPRSGKRGFDLPEYQSSSLGALKALETLAPLEPESLAQRLDTILDAGSVIAKDATMGILPGLARTGHYEKTTPIMLDRIGTDPVNQWPAYAEIAADIVAGPERARLIAILEWRLAGVSQPAKQKRIAKVIGSLLG